MTEAASFKPTQRMAAAARRGLKLRDKFGRGGTEVGLARARQLAEGENLTEQDVKSMYSYFARHKVDKDSAGDRWNNDRDPSNGYIAWLLWGGDAGEAWVQRKRESSLKG